MNINRSIISQLIQHAQTEAPIEACGYLAGNDDGIRAVFRMKNVDASPEHFSFEPAEQFAVARQIRAAKLRLCAVYHSHPATPARPSQEDIRLANDPSLSYIIISLAGSQPDVKSFRIRDGQVAAEELNVIAG
jgi:[CysO sulfur-carrier protein]-S-L-cysteine hydrolase